MLFSILIPTYNNEQTIVRAISSALNQDYSDDYEVIVVNNASTDSTLQKIQSFSDSRVKVFSNPQTVHMYENHNLCIKYAKGDYVIFCHSDDELCPSALTILSNELERRYYPSKCMIWGHSMIRDFSWAFASMKQLIYNTMFSGEPAKRLFFDSGLTPSGTCFSRKAMLGLGCFPIVEGTYDMDWAFELMAAFDGWEFEMLDRLLYKREYASTYSDDISFDIRVKQMQTAATYVYNHLNSAQQKDLLRIWGNTNSIIFNHLFSRPIPTKEEKLDSIIDRYKQAPWKVWKLLKYILMKWNIWN